MKLRLINMCEKALAWEKKIWDALLTGCGRLSRTTIDAFETQNGLRDPNHRKVDLVAPR